MNQVTLTSEELNNMIVRFAARHMWMAIPKELEEYLVTYIINTIDPKFLDEKPGGCLCSILTELTWAYHVGWIDLKNPDPYSQMENYVQLPDFEVVGPYETGIKITNREDSTSFYEADEESVSRMLWECEKYGHYYLR
jgi:hypothetical protein